MEQTIFFNRIGSICTHAEEALGSDLFIKITVNKATVNPVLTFTSMVMFFNQNGKLKLRRNYTFQVAQLRNDEWADNFINTFHSQHPDCKAILGVLTSTKDINWYIDFVTTNFGGNAIDRNGQQIML